MQVIKINGIEIEFEDGLDLQIEDGGKKIIVRGNAAPVTVITTYPYPHYQPYIPWPTYPTYAPVWGTGPTCGDQAQITC